MILKECPFCRGEARIVEASEAGNDAYVVSCRKCQASSAVVFAIKESAAPKLTELWNRRAASLDRAAQVEPPREFTNTREPHRQTVPVKDGGEAVPTKHELMSQRDLLASFDAQVWGREFRKVALNLGYSDMDEGWLIGWFSCALMRGYDEYRWRQERKVSEPPAEAVTGDGVRSPEPAPKVCGMCAGRGRIAAILSGETRGHAADAERQRWAADNPIDCPQCGGKGLIGTTDLRAVVREHFGAAPSASQEPGEVPRGTASGETVVDSTQSNPTSRTISQEPQHKCDAEDGYPCTVCGKFEEPAQAGGDGKRVVAAEAAPIGAIATSIETASPSPTSPERAQDGCYIKAERCYMDGEPMYVRSGALVTVFLELGPLPNNPGYRLIREPAVTSFHSTSQHFERAPNMAEEWRAERQRQEDLWLDEWPTTLIEIGDRLSAALSVAQQEREDAEAEIDLFMKDTAALREKLSAAQGEIERLTAGQQREFEMFKAAEADAARMRPVVAAAKKWRRDYVQSGTDLLRSRHELIDAVDAYTAATKGDTNV